jgi:hypothetical protein
MQIRWNVITGYGNEEEVPLKILQPSQGREARKLQEAVAAQDVQQELVIVFLSDGPFSIFILGGCILLRSITTILKGAVNCS